jgi:hypothetical protein
VKARCSIGKFLAEAPDEEAAAVIAAVESQVQYQAISTAMKGFDVRIPAYTLSRHFRGICSCDTVPGPTPQASTLTEALTTLRG